MRVAAQIIAWVFLVSGASNLVSGTDPVFAILVMGACIAVLVRLRRRA